MAAVIEAPAPTHLAKANDRVCATHPNRYSADECGQRAVWAVGHHGATKVVCEACLGGMLNGGFWCNVCAVSVPPDDLVWAAL